MKNTLLFNRQFLLSANEMSDLPWEMVKIDGFNLFYHHGLEYEQAKKGEVELHLLGFLFDYRNPENTNKNILDILASKGAFNEFIEQLSDYSGHYAIIYKDNDKLILLNDACSQYEIYYDLSFSHFGSQPKLLAKVMTLNKYDSEEEVEFFNSASFKERKLFIGSGTHAENVKHLLPNHFIDLRKKAVTRFFPDKRINRLSIDEASDMACEMIKGYLKAASLRNKIYMGVTAGYDSRVLFLASRDLNCSYYVTKLPDMDESHPDIIIPKELTKRLNKEFSVVTEEICDDETFKILEESIDFPQRVFMPDSKYLDCILINGNLSEIARSFFGNNNNMSGRELAIIMDYPGNRYVGKEYSKWLAESRPVFKRYGYHTLDMFYWEEKMAKWAAKGKTVMGTLNHIVYSPFCSHKLLTILLSTPRRHRDKYYNILYQNIFRKLGPEVETVPVNPSKRKEKLILLKKTGLYNSLQYLSLKIKLIKSIIK